MRKLRVGAKWLVRILLLGLLGLILAAAAILIVLPRAVHGTAMTVLTGSMSPKIPVGSLVIDRPVDPGTLHVGDVATYQKTPGVAVYVTHRIVKINASKTPTMFTLKGDANRGPDLDPVPASAIRGKVWFHVPYLGAVRDAIHTKGGVAGIAAVALAGYAIFQLAGAASARRRTGTGEPVPATAGDGSDWARLRALDSGSTADSLLVIATLPAASTGELTPAEVARLVHGTLLDVADETYTVLIAADPVRDGDTLVLAHAIAPRDALAALTAHAVKLEACLPASGAGLVS